MSLTPVYAQVGNEWINFSQSYFKIPVARDGIYRLTYNDLQAAGFPVSTADPSTIRLFHRGVEQAIYIEGESDSQFNNTDFIEFYGRKNDGASDTELYKSASAQPHTYYNLYSDTTSYFLTVGAGLGKRMATFSEENTSGLPTESFHYDEKLTVLTSQYSGGAAISSEIFSSVFDAAEGWTGAQIIQNQSIDYTLSNITGTVPAAGQPRLELLLVGRGAMNHFVEVYVGSSLRLLESVTFSGYTTYKLNRDIEWSDIAADGKLTVRVRVTGNPDRISVSYLRLQYPQRTDVQGASEKIFNLAENVGGKSYVQLENAPAGLRLYDITDRNNVLRIGTVTTSTLNAVVPSTSSSRKLAATNTILAPGRIKAVGFRQITPAQHDYIIISHPLLRTPALGYSDPVKAYAEYRASAEGGSYDTLVVNTQQLYDQFNYGESSPLAIFRFMKFLSAVNPPKYLFLIGKGMDIWYQYYRNTAAFATYRDLVPTSGYPGSDMLFTAGLNGTTYEPLVPTGRLTAMKPVQVAAYLNKIKEMEALPYDALWRKNILHLSGGIEDNEPALFKGYLEEFQATAEDHYLGGKVAAIAKHSREVQVINIAEQVNKGLGLVTFFGHSSPSTLDFDIGFATDPVMGYNNPGKYPMLIMNGCEAGAFFLNGILFGEDWIFADKKGASGFIAHTSYGMVSTLKQYSGILYEVAFGDSVFIKKGIGDIQKETARRYMEISPPGIVSASQVQQMLLLGDPAVKLFGAPKPDLEINDDNVVVESFDGSPVTAKTDSFRLKLIVRNFGISKPEPLRIEVVRTFNDNSTATYDSLFEMTKYSDTLYFVIRRGEEPGAGNNVFRITIDPDNIIPEMDKNNNSAETGFFVPLNGTKNLFPSSFAIVNDERVSLSFQTTDLLSGEREFEVEVDTVSTFDSPFRKQFTAKGTVLAKQALDLLPADTLAYFWRTRLAQPLAGEQTAWEESSFTYINDGPEGWAQVHFGQYLVNQTEGLVMDAAARKLKFRESTTTVAIKTFGAAAGKPRDSVSVKIAGAEYNLYTQGFGCRNNTMNFIAFDRKSTVPYVGVYFKWYEILYQYGGRWMICGREPFVINSFAPNEMSVGNNHDLIQYVDNIALGDSVVMYNIGDAGYSTWPAAAKTKLGELGVSVGQIDALQPGEPVVIFGRKGLPPGAATIYRTSNAPVNQAKLTVNETITGRYTSGTMSSRRIGPALHWEALVVHPQAEPVDQAMFDLVGVRLNGEEDVLMEDLTTGLNLTFVDPDLYPYLKIVFHSGDDVNLTPAQLTSWLVTYTPVAEGLLLYEGTAEPQTLSEGERWKGQYRFVNISDKSFTDSLQVSIGFFNQEKHVSDEVQQKITAPAPGDTTRFTVDLSTAGKGGINDINVFVNPRIVPEQYYDNNVLELKSYLMVEPDQLNPVLDVTIDGRHVANGDFVSANPLILVRLWDENPYLLKKDTSGVRIFLTYPCLGEDCPSQRVNLSGDDVIWFPATDTSDFRVEFRPQDLQDGEYTLRVEGTDEHGNSSGAGPYEVTFIVQNETTVTFSPPYPNPFSFEIYLPFTVTGSAAPEAFALQIVDVHGKLVRTFTPELVHTFYVGKNHVAWDGADANGNTLPSGVYVYKLSLVVNGKAHHTQGKLVVNR